MVETGGIEQNKIRHGSYVLQLYSLLVVDVDVVLVLVLVVVFILHYEDVLSTVR